MVFWLLTRGSYPEHERACFGAGRTGWRVAAPVGIPGTGAEGSVRLSRLGLLARGVRYVTLRSTSGWVVLVSWRSGAGVSTAGGSAGVVSAVLLTGSVHTVRYLYLTGLLTSGSVPVVKQYQGVCTHR